LLEKDKEYALMPANKCFLPLQEDGKQRGLSKKERREEKRREKK